MALRYAKSTRREAYVTFLSVLAAGGISLGVAALILVLAGLSGLQDFLRRDVLDRTPHIEIELPPNSQDAEIVSTLAARDDVIEAQRILRGRGWLRSTGRVLEAEVVGFEGSLPRSFPAVEVQDGLVVDVSSNSLSEDLLSEDLLSEDLLSEDLLSEDPLAEGLVLSQVLSSGWGIRVGDTVDIVSPRPTLTPFGPQPRLRRLKVTGIFRSGQTEDGQQRIAMPLRDAERLFSARQRRIEVRTADLESALTVARELPTLLPEGSRVRTWEDLNRGLFFALRLEKALMFVTIFLIVPIAAFALVTVLALLISSKRQEIAMLQAMGAEPIDLRRAFLFLGAGLGSLGLAVGGVVGIVGAWLLDRFELISPPGDVYFIDHIPFLIEGQDLFSVLFLTAALTLLATFYASRRAGVLRTVEVLRH